MIKVITLLLVGMVPTLAQAACVILLHGLARSPSSMESLEQALTSEGFKAVNLGYPSRQFAIDELAELAITPALEHCAKEDDIHFVTHSLGGILVRQYLTEYKIDNLKYVVMLGPPNQGSEVVDKLEAVPGFHFINGDAGLQLGTGALSVPNSLGPANFNVGIIAGSKSINWILSALIPGTDDGKVAVERTTLEGMNDHVELPVTHPFMMNNDQVISEVIYYLKRGQFSAREGK
ncbi:alpha/beta hydrolase [Simiduia curdlanivorans]|uniref:Esterase/lipase family protein n=1 Tax=Simiduia curdlanivorans TaxID=1492769 RepID=A0ABV8V6B3_9GAMM|nr:alpha/beta hydrolase [Simiduia curdlanivorans]MDN3640262.1 alpha/beta hydrolase [Simiduia curdlanivorans]